MYPATSGSVPLNQRSDANVCVHGCLLVTTGVNWGGETAYHFVWTLLYVHDTQGDLDGQMSRRAGSISE